MNNSPNEEVLGPCPHTCKGSIVKRTEEKPFRIPGAGPFVVGMGERANWRTQNVYEFFCNECHSLFHPTIQSKFNNEPPPAA